MSIFDKINTLEQTTEEKINKLSGDELQGIKQNVLDSALINTPYGAYENVNGRVLPYVGKARTYYSDTTNQEAIKEGLATARGGFAKRYEDDSKLGPLGVTPENGADLEVLTPYDVATQVEYQIHSNKGMLENRAAGTGYVDQSVKDAYGSGYTEYYTKDAPLYNPQTQASENPLPEGTWIPDAPERYAPEGFERAEPNNLLNRMAGEYGSISMNDKDGMIGESLDIAQSSLIQQYGKTNKALREMSRWAADKVGLDQETIDAWLPNTKDTGTIGFGDTASTELAQREVADKITGVMAKTREEQDAKMESALKNVEEGNYGAAGLDVLTIMPYILGDSAGEITSLMAGYPGIALAVAGRVNEDAEEYEKNNDGKKVDGSWILGSTLSNFAVLVGERLVVGKVLGSMKKGLSNTLADKGKDVFYSALGETAQEYADQTQQMYMTQKKGERTLGEIATGPEARLAALTGGAMGGSTSGAGAGVAVGVESADKGLQYLDEKIKYKTNTLDNPDRIVKPVGSDGKFNVWDSVGHPDYKVTDPKAKEVHAETIAEFAVDLRNNKESMEKYGYRNKNLGEVLTEATDKIAKVYELNTPEERDLATYLLVQKMDQYGMSKETDRGQTKVDPKDRKEMMQEIADFVKGNKPGEIAFLEMQKREIRDAFQSNVDYKKAREFMDAFGLNENENGEVMAKLATLTDEQHENMKSLVNSMKLMGSADSVIIEDMDEIIKELDSLRTEIKRMGSSEGPTTDGEKGPKKMVKKSYLEVANEISNVGFLSQGRVIKKSTKDHARDIETFVGKPGISKDIQNRHINQLETFVKYRGIDRVRPVRVEVKNGVATRKLNTTVGIASILKSKMIENRELQKIIGAKLRELKSTKDSDAEVVARFEQMNELMKDNQAIHMKMFEDITSNDEATKIATYHTLNSTSTQLDEDVLTEMLDTSNWDVRDTEYRSYNDADTRSANMGVEEQITGEELRNARITNVALAVNEGTQLDPEDTQFYESNKKAIDAEVANIQNVRGTQQTTKVPTGAYLEKNEYKEIVHGDITTGPLKVEKEPLKTTPIDEGVSEDQKVKSGDTPIAQRKQELKKVTEAKNYADWLDKQLDNAISEVKKLSGKNRVLKELQRDYYKDLRKAKSDLHKARKKIFEIDELKDRLEKAPEGVYVRGMNRFKDGMKQLTNIVRALKGVITRYLKKIVKLQDAEELTATEIGEIEVQLNKLGKKIGAIKREQKRVQVEEARSIRAGMEEVLGGLVKENKSTDNSISALISKGATIDEIMELMPNIIRKNKDGKNIVQKSIEFLKSYGATKYDPDLEAFPNRWFTQQKPGEDGYKNPLKELLLGDNKVAFENLWKLEDKENTDPEYKAWKNEIRKHVKEAMNIATVVTLKQMIDVRIDNAEQRREMVNQGFGPVINNLESDAQLTQMNKIGKDLRSGKYVPEAVFRENAGRFMLDQLELRLSPELTIQERADLQTALGVMVVNNMLPAGWVTNDAGKRVSISDAKKNGQVDNTVRRGVVKVVNGAAQYQDAGDVNIEEDGAAVRVINLQELQKDYIKEVGETATVFEFAAARDDGQISLTPITKKDDATIKNSDVPLAQGVKDYLNREGSRPWKFIGLDEKVAKAKEIVGKDGDYVQWFKDSILGTEEELLADTATMKLDSELAKFRAEELIIERMLKAHELVGDGNKFYIGWDYTVSGRSMMSGKLINPQSSGISRFLVAAEDMITKIDTAKIDQESIDHLELAVAQAVDIGIDKTTADKALNELHGDFVQIIKKDGKLELKWGKNKRLQKLVQDPEFNLGNVRKLDSQIAELMDTDPSAAELEFGSKTIMHLVQAVELLREIESGKTDIETNLALEADGITNGMAIVLMQMGWSDFTQNLLQKAGVYAKDDKYQNHGQYKDAGNTDIYESPIAKIGKSLGTELTAQIDELIGGKWRNFMKNPVMTFIYGAGMNNITKSVAESLIIGNSYIPGALALGKIDALLKFAEVDGITPEYKEYVKIDDKIVLQDTDKRDAKYAYLQDWQITKLTKAIHKKIEDPFASGFKATFNEIIDFRKALKTVEQVNYTIFRMKFKEKVAALGKDKMGTLTSDELLKIKQEMMDEGTYYSTDSAIGGTIDYWKTGKSDTEQDRISVTINTNDFQSDTGGFAKTYNKVIKELEANIGAIGVTTIHAVDGTIMIEGHTDAVLNVYDALMMGADFKKNEAQIQNMNKSFYDVNTRHSILGKAVEKMEFMLGQIADSKIDPELAVKTLADITRIQEDTELSEVVNQTMETLDKIDAQRRTLVDTEMTVNQYAAATDVAGVDSNDVEIDISGRYAVYGESTDKTVIREGLEWLVNTAIDLDKQEEVKAETATIPAEVIAELENLFKSSDNSVKRIMRDTAKKMAGVDSNQFSVALKELTKDC